MGLKLQTGSAGSLECDSEAFISDLIQTKKIPNLEDSILNAIFGPLNRNWEVSVKHTYSEGNKCADGLVNLGAKNYNIEGILDIPMAGINYLLLADLMRISLTRLASC